MGRLYACFCQRLKSIKYIMIKHKKTSKFKNKFNKSVITGIAVTVGIVSTFSAYFNPKPIFAQEQKQEKTVVIDSKKYYITGILEDRYNLTKEEKKIILEEENGGKQCATMVI